jgi:hypothetical protein
VADLDYAKVTGRFALSVGDTLSDTDDNPDIVWCTSGRVFLTPLTTFVKVSGAAPGPFTMGNAVIEAEIDSEGRLRYQGKPYLFVVDLTSDKVNPPIAAGKATHRVTFSEVMAGDTRVDFPEFTCRLTAAGADADGENDLTRVAPVVPGTASPIYRGEQGVSVASLETTPDGQLLAVFTDGTEVDAGPLPVGPGGSDTGVAGYLGTEGTAARAAARSLVAADAQNPSTAIGGALSASFVAQYDVTGKTTAQINAWLALPSPMGAKRMVGTVTITAPLVIHSNTYLDATGASITLAPGSNCRMMQNAAYKGAAARDVNITLVGGTWDRGNNDGATGADTHSLVFHRVDRLRVLDGKHLSTAGKYAILVADVTDFAVERHTFNVAADGVHIIGPASNGVVRTITGTTGDDCVAITARDYPAYDLTPGGGNVTNVTIEDVFSINGLKQAVKIFAGLGNAVSGITIQRVRGNVATSAVSIFHDTVVPELLGGTITGVAIRDVDVLCPAPFSTVVISAPGVDNVTIDGLVANSDHALTVTGSGVIGTVRLQNVDAPAEFDSNLVDVQAGATVANLILRDVVMAGKGDKTAGRLFNVAGIVNALTVANAVLRNGDALGFINGSCPKITLSNIESTANYGVRHTAANPCAVSVVNGNFTTTLGILRVSGGAGASGAISGSGITSTVAAAARTGTQPLRVNGAQFRADLAALVPTAGDQVYNTNSAIAGGVGPCVTDGASWKNLMTAGTYYAPFSGTAFLDQFAGTGPLHAHAPNTGKVWTDSANGFVIDANGVLANLVSATALAGYFATGDATMTGTLSLTSEASTLIARVFLKYVDSNNYVRLEVTGSGVNPTVKISKVIGGTTTDLATLGGSLNLNADGATYSAFPFTFSVVGTTVTLTMNGNTATGTLTSGDVTALAAAQRIGLIATRHLRIAPGLKVDVVGNYAA